MPADGADQQPTAIFRNTRNEPLRFWLDGSIQSRDLKQALRHQIERHGGAMVAKEEQANCVLVNSDGLDNLRLKRTANLGSDNALKRSTLVEPAAVIKTSIKNGRWTPSTTKVKGMSGRVGKKNPYTPQEDLKLAKYLASRIPDKDRGGRKGMNLYTDLVNLPDVDPEYNWAKAHPAQSWRNRYMKREEHFDALIEQAVPTVNPHRDHRYEQDRMHNKIRYLDTMSDNEEQEEEEEDEEEQELQQAERGPLQQPEEMQASRPSTSQPTRNPSRPPTLMRAGMSQRPSNQQGAGPSDNDTEVARGPQTTSGTTPQARRRPRASDGHASPDRQFPFNQLEPELHHDNLPAAKRQRVDNGSFRVVAKEAPRRAARRPVEEEESGESEQESDSSALDVGHSLFSEDEEEAEAERTTYISDDGVDLVISTRKKSLASQASERFPISQRTLIGTEPRNSLNQDIQTEMLIRLEEPDNESDDENQEFWLDSSSPVVPRTRSAAASQALQPTREPVHTSPIRLSVARKTASNVPARMTRARSRSQSVEPQYFESLPMGNDSKARGKQKGKGKGKEVAPPLEKENSPILETLEEGDEESAWESRRETLEEEHDVLQLITNQEGYSAGTSNLDDFETGISEASTSKRRRSPSLESDDAQMSAQLKMAPPKPKLHPFRNSMGSLPSRTAAQDPKEVLKAYRREKSIAALARPARPSLPPQLLTPSRYNTPRDSNITRQLQGSSRIQESTPFSLPSARNRAPSPASSTESYPLAGTRAAAYNRRKKEKEKHTPYTPQAGTRASLLLNSPPMFDFE
ncbi:hypothetical protein FA15DRAFT_197430 [Coprinopsis marcescibilis]|uniref:Rap1 Myb domain-containing protein n=1 Tax=Coprinopsis marcescibilis TaxID=230819 RepID=A0A5C3LAI8_COPMA|nr:hypothetical protein FA15DRAFT_197430 [Coprinopsis marcescibilis]